ncbi:MAG: manganese efflux pump MntP family protein [Bacillota bacterium]
MPKIELLLLAAALGTDAFSLCLGLGLAGMSRRRAEALIFIVFIFHILMPLAGWLAGGLVGRLAGRAAAFVGALVLVYLGARMIYGAAQRREEAVPPVIVLAGLGTILMLGLSVSLDALGVGFTLGVTGGALLETALVIGLVAGLMTAAGFALGRRVGNWAGRWAHLAGGAILVGVGVRLLA